MVYDILIVDTSGWSLWDNRRISQDVFAWETFDGFHFDRENIFSVEDHIHAREKETNTTGYHRGLLLLFASFYLLDNHI